MNILLEALRAPETVSELLMEEEPEIKAVVKVERPLTMRVDDALRLPEMERGLWTVEEASERKPPVKVDSPVVWRVPDVEMLPDESTKNLPRSKVPAVWFRVRLLRMKILLEALRAPETVSELLMEEEPEIKPVVKVERPAMRRVPEAKTLPLVSILNLSVLFTAMPKSVPLLTVLVGLM